MEGALTLVLSASLSPCPFSIDLEYSCQFRLIFENKFCNFLAGSRLKLKQSSLRNDLIIVDST